MAYKDDNRDANSSKEETIGQTLVWTITILLVAIVLASCAPKATTIPTGIVVPTITSTSISPTSLPEILDCGGGDIAFVSDRDGNDEIYAINIDGTNLRNLTKSVASDTNPYYSPDGKYIAFWSDRNGDEYNQDVFVMNSDGTNVINLSKQTIKLKGGSFIYWSLDGQQIGTLHTLYEGVIFTINPKTFEVIKTERISGESFDKIFIESKWFEPKVYSASTRGGESLSPNGICATYADGYDNYQIYIKTELKTIKITNDDSSNSCPAWQP